MTEFGVEAVAEATTRVRQNVGRVIVGKEEAVTLLLVALMCEGHVLLEDVPGVGKTTLAKALARSLDLTFQRIQFTPDLLPSDVTGISYFNQQTQQFQFRHGPVFANVLLADEINRATPRTQSALLEAMEERQVTVDGETRSLPRPFFVLATENPIELEGTFPLPEAQLDRFLFKVRLDYPGEEELVRIISTTTGPEEAGVEPAFPADEAAARVEALKRLVRSVIAAPAIEQYAARMVRATQPQSSRFLSASQPRVREDAVDRYVMFGSSPRGAQALILSAKVRALLDGRANVAREDIDDVAVVALAHRIMLNYAAHSDGVDARQVVERVVRSVRSAGS